MAAWRKDMGEGEERVRCMESNLETYITVCKTDSQWEFAVWRRELKQGLCINLEGWDGEGVGGRFKREGTYVYLWLIHVDVWQKTTKFYKAIILPLKINKKFKKTIRNSCHPPSIHHPSTHQTVKPYTLQPSIHPPTHHLSIHLPTHSSTHPSICHPSTHLPTHPSIYPSTTYPSTSIHLSIHLLIQHSKHISTLHLFISSSSIHPPSIHHPLIHHPFIDHPLIYHSSTHPPTHHSSIHLPHLKWSQEALNEELSYGYQLMANHITKRKTEEE